MDKRVPRFTYRNEPFVCIHCGASVRPSKRTCRNHCPYCLYSRHLDVQPGDRMANCGGTMVPIAFFAHTKKGWQVVHRCEICGHETKNILDFDDPFQPDSMDRVVQYMRENQIR